jgi:hypothetical protein
MLVNGKKSMTLADLILSMTLFSMMVNGKKSITTDYLSLHMLIAQ